MITLDYLRIEPFEPRRRRIEPKVIDRSSAVTQSVVHG